MGRNKEKSTYVNPLGQKVVDVDYGYKVYDTDEPDKVVLYVGENTENGGYIYLDVDAIKEGRNDIAFMNTSLMKKYETVIKNITATMPDDEAISLIKKINLNCGFSGKKLSCLFKDFGSLLDLDTLVSIFKEFEFKFEEKFE